MVRADARPAETVAETGPTRTAPLNNLAGRVVAS